MRNQSRLQFRSIFRVKVSDPKSGALIGYVGDVSEHGLRVLSDKPFTPGAVVSLRMRMRLKEDETLQFDLLDMICRWSGTNAKTGYFEAGFLVEHPSAEFSLMVENMRIQRGEAENDS
jgi:hypothetical protein